MGELEEKISGILGDREQMAKITQLAQSLMGGEAMQDGTGADGQPHPASNGSAPAGASGGLDLGGLDLDPELLGRVGRLLRSGGAQNKEEQALLDAMRPYLSEKRRGKMDRAIKIARLARLARLAIGEMEGDGDA